MGIISRFGRWLDTRFPEKIPTEEVIRSLTQWATVSQQIGVLGSDLKAISHKMQAFENGARAFDKQLSDMTDELNKVKSIQAMAQRIRTSSPLPTSEAWKR